MHTPRRFILGLLLCALTVLGVSSGLALRASVSTSTGTDVLAERGEKLTALQEAMGASTRTAASAPGLYVLKAEGEKEFAQAQEELVTYGKQKRDVRFRIASALQQRDTFVERYGVDPLDGEVMDAFLAQQRSAFTTSLQTYERVLLHAAPPTGDFRESLFPQVLYRPLAQQVEDRLRYTALRDLRMRLLASAQEMQGFSSIIADLRAEHAALLASYDAVLEKSDAARRKIALSDAKLAEIKSIVAAVESRIQAMQADLAAYDERIRNRAEGELIARGLLSERRTPSSAVPKFSWPAVGNITAKFLDPAYKAYFGVPHEGIDIAQPQGSIVRVAADGVVHYVQYGGNSGYSYVLVAHRGGYATLYGHLSQITVAAGEDIDKGQMIGLSGGLPGTSGAGPMTTGAHLHFEVILNGEHLNPLSVLP